LARAAALAAVIGLTASIQVTVPAAASEARSQSAPKVCLKNESGQELYFKAVYPGVSTGGSKLSSGSKFCSRNPLPSAVRVSLERKSGTLCSAPVSAGYTYTLTAPPKGGQCQWTRTAN
ncbi:MAG: hypothetical protein ABJI04_08265, partial [Marinomonas sp.]